MWHIAKAQFNFTDFASNPNHPKHSNEGRLLHIIDWKGTSHLTESDKATYSPNHKADEANPPFLDFKQSKFGVEEDVRPPRGGGVIALGAAYCLMMFVNARQNK